MSAAVDTHEDQHHGADDHHDHPPFLAHHFETPQQQFDSGKLGIWLFLITEILFFSGLFCAYLVYRATHPEIFLFAHEVLDTKLGAINTVVLIVSSLTMAWAVRAAQLSQQKTLVAMLSLTLVFAGVFLVIKYFEYTAKFDHGYYAGKYNAFYLEQAEGGSAPSVMPVDSEGHEGEESHSHDKPSDHGHSDEEHAHDDDHSSHADHHEGEHVPHGPAPKNTHIFFGIYYMMTGLHGVHIVGGMIAIGWLLYRAVKGHFNSEYFGPVDYVGMYWHLVDLIWIYLFPLLYLIRS